MARNFAFGSNYVDCSIGALSDQDGGPVSIVAIVRLDDTRGGLLVLRTSGGTTCVGVNCDSGDYYFSANGFTTLITAATGDGWHVIGATKANGTATPRAHKYVYSTNTWTHQDGGGTVADSGTTPGGTGVTRIGRFPDDNNDNLQGDIAVMGVWNRVLSDVEVEQLAFSLTGWLSASPDALWVLDQSATSQKVLDLTGGGANESSLTGTSVSTSSVPVWGYGAPAIAVTADAGSSSTNALAEAATATAAANDPTASVAPVVEVATATASANDPAVSIGASAGEASATAAGQDASTSVAPTAEFASATASALDATVTTDGVTNAAAECATATASALDASISVGAQAELASATAAAFDLSALVSVAAECATATASALDATVPIGAGTMTPVDRAGSSMNPTDRTVAGMSPVDRAGSTMTGVT